MRKPNLKVGFLDLMFKYVSNKVREAVLYGE